MEEFPCKGNLTVYERVHREMNISSGDYESGLLWMLDKWQHISMEDNPYKQQT